MMIADLVDGEDFRQRLVALGIDIPPGASPQACACAVRAAQPVDGLPEVVAGLCCDGVTLLPEVRRAVEFILEP